MGFEYGFSYMKLKINRYVYSFVFLIKFFRLLFCIINIIFGYCIYFLYIFVKFWMMFLIDIVI